MQALHPVRTSSSIVSPFVAPFVAVAGGLALGIGTQVLQGELPGSWGVLANSGTAWAFGAFAVGASMR